MSKTLLLRLAGPLQSWGYNSRFENRAAGREPTKSGVAGMIAAALGRRRDEEIEDIRNLRFGVRIDKSGVVLKDYQTAKLAKESSTRVSNRYYLSDAVFLVGLEGDRDFLVKISDALSHPRFTLFLGRRACPPTLPIVLGFRDMDLVSALKKEPLLVTESHGKVTILYDDESVESFSVKEDLPLSFHPAFRKYGYRKVREEMIDIKEPVDATGIETEHDAMKALEG